MKEMRPAPGTFGHQAMEYHLPEIVRETSSDFYSIYRKFKELSDRYEAEKEGTIIKDLYDIRTKMIKSGTVSVVMAVTALDKVIYMVSCSRYHYEDVEKAVRNMGFVKKWVFLTEKIKGVALSRSNPAILSLKELVSARNAIIHPRVQWITNENCNLDEGNEEWDLFLKAASNIEDTYRRCVDLLQK